jgi:hypothetical protein
MRCYTSVTKLAQVRFKRVPKARTTHDDPAGARIEQAM